MRPDLVAAQSRAAIDPADIRKILEGFDVGIFVRSTDGDGRSDWAIRLVPYIAAMARLQEACGLPESTDALGPVLSAFRAGIEEGPIGSPQYAEAFDEALLAKAPRRALGPQADLTEEDLDAADVHPLKPLPRSTVRPLTSGEAKEVEALRVAAVDAGVEGEP